MTLITRSMQILRDNDPGNKNRFLTVVDTCNSFSPLTRLKYIFNGKKNVGYSSHPDILKAWAAMEKNTGRNSEGAIFLMATDDDDPFFVLGPMMNDPYRFSDIEGIEISFNISKPLLKPEGTFSFHDCLEFFKAIINSYEAYTGFIHDSDMEQLVTFGFVSRTIKAQLPSDQWKYIPVPEIIKKIPADLAKKFENLYPPENFNRLEIPEAIYWFNYWNPYMVEHVGDSKIKKAPCEVVEKQKNGGYILIVQKQNFDTDNVEHLKKLAAVYDHFNLYELQKKHLFR